MKKLTIGLLKVYQKYLSPSFRLFWPGSVCRYQPTCSEYALEAVDKYGAVKGLSLAFKRIVSCHPFSKGGLQPVP